MRRFLSVIAGIASVGMITVSLAMTFAFGRSFGQTALEGWAYGTAFAFGDLLKVACPIVVSACVRDRRWRAVLAGSVIWASLTFCSFTSAIGFASANRTFVMDARTVQATLNAS